MKKYILIIALFIVGCTTVSDVDNVVKKDRIPTVSVTLDKSEYIIGESLKIKIMTDMPVLYTTSDPGFGIQYWEEEWIDLYEGKKVMYQTAEEPVGYECYFRLLERSPLVQLEDTKEMEWNGRLCMLGWDDPMEAGTVENLEQGKYRLVWYYGLEVDDKDPYRLKESKTVYSEGFVVR